MLKPGFISSVRRIASRMAPMIVGVAATSLAGLGCSSSTDAGSCAMFTAYQPTYQDFHSWTAFSFQCEEVAGSPHPAGPCTVYINQLPPAGATEFAVGTIIVKEFHNGTTPVGDTVLAMSKRGCGYNSGGAVNWQWAQLSNLESGAEQLMWSDVVAPAGETYLNTGMTCNQCHVGAKSNDFVQSPPLQLPTLEAWEAAGGGDAGAADASGIGDAGGDQ